LESDWSGGDPREAEVGDCAQPEAGTSFQPAASRWRTPRDGRAADGYSARGGAAGEQTGWDGYAVCDGGCLGRSLALLKLRVVLPMVADRFRADRQDTSLAWVMMR